MTHQPKNIALVCNVLAGAGKAVVLADEITRELSARSITHTVFRETWPDDFSGYTDVFIVGGDGTLNYFVNRYPKIGLPLAVFAGGTGNDFHWLLHGNTTLPAQLNLVLEVGPKPVDLGKCNDRYFINGVGIGFEGEVVKALGSKDKQPGKSSYMLTILKNIFTYRSMHYAITSAEASINGRKLLADISNGRRAGGGFHVAPEASADDGLLDVVICDAINPVQRLRYLPVIEKGKHLGLPFIRHFRTGHIKISSDEKLQYHLDGEYLEAEALDIRIIPAALQIRY